MYANVRRIPCSLFKAWYKTQKTPNYKLTVNLHIRKRIQYLAIVYNRVVKVTNYLNSFEYLDLTCIYIIRNRF